MDFDSVPLELSSSPDGLSLAQPNLGFEASGQVSLNFVSSLTWAFSHNRIPGKQILVSERAFQTLTKRFPQTRCLALGFNKPMTFGNVTLTLHPSGESNGSAFLHVERGKNSLLYASHWSSVPSVTARMSLPVHAKHLIIRLMANPFRPKPASFRKEMERLKTLAQTTIQSGRNLFIICDAINECDRIAPNLVDLGFPLCCDDRSFRVLRTIHQGLQDLWVPGRLPDNASKPSIVFVSKNHLSEFLRSHQPSGDWVLIQSAIPYPHQMPPSLQIADVFHLQIAPCESDVRNLIEAVAPERITILGDEAQYFLQHFKGCRIPLHPMSDVSCSTLFGI